MDFTELGLSEAVLKGVEAAGYTEPTTIQAKAIPAILNGRDVIGASQTGTGKTAAFVLPILSKLEKPGKIRCLILEPVRELAGQVEVAIQDYASGTGLKSVVIYGGVGYGPQTDSLKAGVDIIIATPGRLLDLMSRGDVSLEHLEFLVLDEVDRMLDMGFLPDVRRIVEKCSKKRQTLFFSATMPPAIETFASWLLTDPFEIEVGQRIKAADTVSHAFYPVASSQREDLLQAILKATDFHSVMVFTRTKRDADGLATMLRKGTSYDITVMHSDIKQSERAKALEGFRKGTFDVIIATDLAARGLDISNVSHVINYNVPENAEDYVHRIGRTGRAKREGDAFTILSADELPNAESIERLIGQKIDRRKLDGFDYTYTTLLDEDAPDQKKLDRMFNRRPKGGKRRKRK